MGLMGVWQGPDPMATVEEGLERLGADTVCLWGAYGGTSLLDRIDLLPTGIACIPYGTAMSNLAAYPTLADMKAYIDSLSAKPNVPGVVVVHEVARTDLYPKAEMWLLEIAEYARGRGVEPVAIVDNLANADQQFVRKVCAMSVWATFRPYSYHGDGPAPGWWNWDMGEHPITTDGRAWDVIAARLPALTDTSIGPIGSLDAVRIAACGIPPVLFEAVKDLGANNGKTMYPTPTIDALTQFLPYLDGWQRKAIIWHYSPDVATDFEFLQPHWDLCRVVERWWNPPIPPPARFTGRAARYSKGNQHWMM